MSTVTSRIKQITQPSGGYLPPAQFNMIQIQDGIVLNDSENVHPSVVGMVVDYMSRFLHSRCSAKEAFAISLAGAKVAEKIGVSDARADAFVLLKHIKGLDDESIKCACELVRYDAWFRNPKEAIKSLENDFEAPDGVSIQNIKTMIIRSLHFFDDYGPVVESGFTFEADGYTKVVDSGDGDFLTRDTLWDFKVSKNPLTSKHTLQILMYWIMGQHSKKPVFKGITKIGVFNPRLNVVYLLDINEVSSEVISLIEKEVICY